ncbi:hypothetical protein ACE6H2_017753 [Prunus campanulata]
MEEAMGFSAQPLQWVGEKCGGPAPLAYTPITKPLCHLREMAEPKAATHAPDQPDETTLCFQPLDCDWAVLNPHRHVQGRIRYLLFSCHVSSSSYHINTYSNTHNHLPKSHQLSLFPALNSGTLFSLAQFSATNPS